MSEVTVPEPADGHQTKMCHSPADAASQRAAGQVLQMPGRLQGRVGTELLALAVSS